MSATEDATEPLKLPDSGDANSDHGYFQALEEAFIRLRGAPLLLSPADWQMAKQWREQGIPIDLVERVLAEVLEERRSRPGADRIVTLRYFRRPVENAWKALGAIGSSGVRGESEVFDTEARLGQLAASLPADLAEANDLSRRILGLEGDPEKVEQALVWIEDELLDRLEGELSEAKIQAIDLAIDQTVSVLSAKVDAQELEITRSRLKREAVRRHFGLPVLSLFAVRD